MWILYSILAALFAGISSLFAKFGIKDTNVNVATFIKSIIISVFTCIIVLIKNQYMSIININYKNWILLILSGIFTFTMWYSYFKALSMSSISKVLTIDKVSIATTLMLSLIVFKEKIDIIKLISIFLIIIGSLIIIKKDANNKKNNKWIIYALITALCTSIIAILSKYTINTVSNIIAILIRSFTVLIIMFILIIIKKEYKNFKTINKKKLFLISMSSITTCISWLFYFEALKTGETSVVFTLEKLNFVFPIIFSCIYFKSITLKEIVSIIIIVSGILLLLF